MSINEGDRVRVDIPDETDPNHGKYHGKHGSVVAIIQDDGNTMTGRVEDADLFRVEFDDGSCADFRYRDLRPPIND